MKTINLIPIGRRQAKAQRRRLVKWAGGLGVYCLVLIAGSLLSSRYGGGPGQALASEAVKADVQLKAARSRTALLNEELARTNHRLQTVQAIGQQPDWGAMLDLIARNLGPDVVLDSCRLQSLRLGDKEAKASPADAAKPADGGCKPIILEITGLAKRQADVSDCMLRLEKLGLFSKIRLIRTSRQPFLDENVTAFRLECLVCGGEGNVQ